MKYGPVTKLRRRNKTTLKKLTITSYQKTVASLPFFQFTANLEQSGSQIPDAYSVKFTFSLIITFYPRDFEILGWCPAGPVIPHGEKVPL